MERIFITTLVPKDSEIEDRVSIAACNFSRNLMTGRYFDKVYSIPAVYIHQIFDCDDEVQYMTSYIRKCGYLFKYIAPIFEQMKLFFKIPKNSSVWFYNLSTLNCLLFLLLRTFKHSVLLNVIVLDFTPGAKFNNYFLKLINKCHGIITLADNSLFINKNKCCIPGVVPNDSLFWPVVEKPIVKKFLLSGSMSEQISQVSKILEVFSKLSKCQLYIIGKIDNFELLKKYSKFTNIIFHEKLLWKDYLDLLHNCPFVLSTRDVNAPENQCNFPSKIIESLLHNRIVVSTINYKQLSEIKILKVDNEVHQMFKDFEKIEAISDQELIIYANQSDKIKQLFNVSVWGKSIKQIEERY